MRLWCWAIDTDRESGRFEADAKQLSQIVKFSGDCQRLLESFLACEVITPTDKPGEFRINGWKINARFFKERKRLRKLRNHASGTHKRTRAKRVEDANKTTHTPSLTYTSSKEEREGAPAAPRAFLDTESPARKTKLVEPSVLAEFRRCTGLAGRELGNFDDNDHKLAGKIYAKRPKDWRAVMHWFVANPAYQFCGWSLKWLAANIDEPAAKMLAPKYTKPPDPAERRNTIQAAKATIERIDEDRNQASSEASRKAAKLALDSIHAQLDKRNRASET